MVSSFRGRVLIWVFKDFLNGFCFWPPAGLLGMRMAQQDLAPPDDGARDARESAVSGPTQGFNEGGEELALGLLHGLGGR